MMRAPRPSCARPGCVREVARAGGKYCSRDCAFADPNWRGAADRKAEMAAVREACMLPCVVCGGSVRRVGARQRACSDSCRLIYSRRMSRDASAAKKVIRERACRECKRPFTPIYGDKRRAFCSHFCMIRSVRRGRPKNHEQRARRAGVPRVYNIKPAWVFERDGWRCQLCGVRTPKRLRGTRDDRAPELDHIIPIAAGGGHLWENVQCSCRKCNIAKGAKPLGQLRLA
jgi:5-methylcytosine-specific restriction endonuclease McrA